MDYKEARSICENFALKHKVIFDDEGECGFGRECVGFNSGGNWIDYNPYDSEYNPIKEYECDACLPPEGVNAYHKHDCLAVLGRGEEAVKQLAQWVLSMEAAGTVEIKEIRRPPPKHMIEALMSGLTQRVVYVRKEAA